MKKSLRLLAAIVAAAVIFTGLPAAGYTKEVKRENREKTAADVRINGDMKKSGVKKSGVEKSGKTVNEHTEQPAERKGSPSHFQKGKALKKGDCIGITAPAYYIEENDFNQAVLFLRDLGYKVKITGSCTSAYQSYAGKARLRAEDLNSLFADDSVDAILCLRGGHGSRQILDYLDYDMIARHPKLLIGYSDITALHIALMQKCHLATVHGPMISSFTDIYSAYLEEVFRRRITLDEAVKGRDISWDEILDLDESSFWDMPMEYTVSQFLRGIASSSPLGEIEMPEGETLTALVPGKARGVIIGGNLSVLTSLVGTAYELRGNHTLLFLEDTGEDAEHIERMLQKLYRNGLFDRVDGILVGQFTGIDEADVLKCNKMMKKYARLAGIPCICGVPAGHENNNMFLPFGVMAKMEAYPDGSAELTLSEPALE